MRSAVQPCAGGRQARAVINCYGHRTRGPAAWTSRSRVTSAPLVKQARRCFRGSQRQIVDSQTRPAVASDHASLEAERSQVVLQEVLLFLLQLECDSQLQRALNYENYETAQAVRDRRTRIDVALATLQDSKKQQGNKSQPTSQERWDLGAEVLRLRGELQRAVEEERYGEAAGLRDQLAAAQAQSQAAEAAAGGGKIGGQLPGRRLALGQRVKHMLHGYRGVICGWDIPCAESAEWQAQAGVDRLPDGADQPFYHVLVDVRDWPDGQSVEPHVTYVAEELLIAPQEPSSWLLEQGSEAFQHPFNYLLFLGTDERGDLLPVRALRERYNQPRRDIFPPPDPQPAP